MIKVKGKKLISTLGVIVLLTLITFTFYNSLTEEGTIRSALISGASAILGRCHPPICAHATHGFTSSKYSSDSEVGNNPSKNMQEI